MFVVAGWAKSTEADTPACVFAHALYRIVLEKWSDLVTAKQERELHGDVTYLIEVVGELLCE